MKPRHSPNSRDVRRDLFEPTAREHQHAPLTDYSYHSIALGESGRRYMRNPRQSFWNIAGNYLKDEARHDFHTEAMLFVFITVTAALPLMNNLHVLIQFVRAITSH